MLKSNLWYHVHPFCPSSSIKGQIDQIQPAEVSILFWEKLLVVSLDLDMFGVKTANYLLPTESTAERGFVVLLHHDTVTLSVVLQGKLIDAGSNRK